MSQTRPRNLPKSVRDRLSTQARERGDDFLLVLTRYALERLLYRLSQSAHRDLFILKGAMLFSLWTGDSHRPTKDLDLLGFGEPDIARFEAIFREVCGLVVEDDGLLFDPQTVRGERIKEEADYPGLRILCVAVLERARIPIQIDVGFGDAVTPAALSVEYPTLLDFPAPLLRAYPRVTVVAEKYQAMVLLGIANSRMKDFYDLWVLARRFAFDGPALRTAIAATFERRSTAIPTAVPLALTPIFTGDVSKMQQWKAFLRKGKLASEAIELAQIAGTLRDFLLPPTESIGGDLPFEQSWPAGGPWQSQPECA